MRRDERGFATFVKFIEMPHLFLSLQKLTCDGMRGVATNNELPCRRYYYWVDICDSLHSDFSQLFSPYVTYIERLRSPYFFVTPEFHSLGLVKQWQTTHSGFRKGRNKYDLLSGLLWIINIFVHFIFWVSQNWKSWSKQRRSIINEEVIGFIHKHAIYLDDILYSKLLVRCFLINSFSQDSKSYFRMLTPRSRSSATSILFWELISKHPFQTIIER